MSGDWPPLRPCCKAITRKTRTGLEVLSLGSKRAPRGKLARSASNSFRVGARAKGLSVGPSGDTEAGKVIQGRRVEIKFSTLWKNGVYNFQQIRDQDYEFLLCLGLSPLDARCWVIPKKALYDYVIGHTPQHTGAGGTDTFWLLFPASDPPIWLESYGGKLSQAFQILIDL